MLLSLVLILVAGLFVAACPVQALQTAQTAWAEGKAVGHGFISHGVPTPVAQSRGVVSTVDTDGRDVVLSWLQDYRGGYALLMVDAENGVSQQFDTPFPVGGEEPSAVLLSSRNRFYTLFNGHFVEFDVAERRFSFWQKTVSGSAMSLTEDGQGRVWAATYPDNHVLMFDPSSQRLLVHGPLARERWAQYPRSIAADRHGWIYVGVGMAASQLYAFNPQRGLVRSLLPPKQRRTGRAEVVQSIGGSVFARHGGQQFLLSDGQIHALPAGSRLPGSAMTSGAQNLMHKQFPSGRILSSFDLEQRSLQTRLPGGMVHRARFRYETRGAFLTVVCAAAGGQVCGGTRFPMHTFLYHPAAQRFDSRRFPRQPNMMMSLGEQLYVAAYPDGALFEARRAGEPAYERLLSATPVVNRPHALVSRADGTLLVMGGTPDYGLTGGGLIFWDRRRREVSTVPHDRLIPRQATQTMLALPDGLILGGTTVKPGTGGVGSSEDSAYLYLLDPDRRQLIWKTQPVPEAGTITDLVRAPDGYVYGLVDSTTLFVLDVRRRQIVARHEFGSRLGPSVFAQGTRAFVPVPASPARTAAVYLLLDRGIAVVDTEQHGIRPVARSPVPISVGGSYIDGRIYFGSDHQLFSWQVP